MVVLQGVYFMRVIIEFFRRTISINKTKNKIPLLVLFFCLFFTSFANSKINCYYTTNQKITKENFKNSVQKSYWPTNDWQITTPEAQGMKSEILNQTLEYISQENLPINSIVVVRNGFIVLESYPDLISNQSSKFFVWSITKSFISALIGIANQTGSIPNINQKILEIFSNWTLNNPDSRKQLITIEHLLLMRSGFNQTFSREIKEQVDSIQYILDLNLIFDPGTDWFYNHGNVHLLSAILTLKTSQTAFKYAKNNLFNHLGIANVVWDEDKRGISIGPSGLYLTPRDMAKFGFLYLHNGTWDGQQVVPKEWVLKSTSAITTMEEEEDDDYGYLWWIGPNREYFSANGLFGQKITVYPKEDLVIVYTANFSRDNPASVSSLDYINNNFILPSITPETTTLPSITTNPETSETSSEAFSNESVIKTTEGYSFLIMGLGMIFILQNRKKKRN
jgi:CubicO group peptidase (beta-lactamase class C family)